MILWIVLFLLIIGISFLLAFSSMRDYQEITQTPKMDYGLFLIRKLENFDESILNAIRDLTHSEKLTISIERLVKGKKSALTIFGPKKILSSFTGKLNLLELEDYAAGWNSKEVFTWEVGMKDSKNLSLGDFNNILRNLPEFADEDQFFWQVILSPKGQQKKNNFFQTQIRAAFFSKDPRRKKIFAPLLQNLNTGGLTKISKPFSMEQTMDFYRLRSFNKDSTGGPVLDSYGVTRMVMI